MALPVEEVLRLWRELERLETTLPADAPERKVVSAHIVKLRRLYKRLTNERERSTERVTASQHTIEDAMIVIRSAHNRIGDVVTSEEVADAWRELDRRLRRMAADDPRRGGLEESLRDLRVLHDWLTAGSGRSAAARLRGSRRTLDLARQRAREADEHAAP